MKPRPRAVYHYGTCLQRGGEGDVLTIADNPIDLSLCGDCLAYLIRDAAEPTRWPFARGSPPSRPGLRGPSSG